MIYFTIGQALGVHDCTLRRGQVSSLEVAIPPDDKPTLTGWAPADLYQTPVKGLQHDVAMLKARKGPCLPFAIGKPKSRNAMTRQSSLECPAVVAPPAQTPLDGSSCAIAMRYGFARHIISHSGKEAKPNACNDNIQCICSPIAPRTTQFLLRPLLQRHPCRSPARPPVNELYNIAGTIVNQFRST